MGIVHLEFWLGLPQKSSVETKDPECPQIWWVPCLDLLGFLEERPFRRKKSGVQWQLRWCRPFWWSGSEMMMECTVCWFEVSS
jgi:hypothetical protein